jgi:two-component sensor histidine kinase
MLEIARQLTLRQRLLAIVAVAILPASLGLAYLIADGHRQLELEVHEQARRTSQIVALEMERIVAGAESVLRTLAVTPAVGRPDCSVYLARVDANLPQLAGFAVAGPDGVKACASGAIGDDPVRDQAWFTEALGRGGFAVGTYTAGPGGVYLPVAIATEEAPPRVLVTAIDLGWLAARLRERNLAEGSALAIADRNGVLIAREPDSAAFVGESLAPGDLSLVRAERPGTTELTSLDGTRRIVGYQPPAATGIGLYVAAGISRDAAFAPIYAATRRTLALASLGALAACLVAWLVGDRLFRRPIRRILATIASWRAGDETARTGIATDASELSELGAAIDEYMDNLVRVRGERAAAEERRSLLLREMNHRIKNVLAAVQAIANQTFKDRATPDSLRTFGNRLQAMAAAHDLLLDENWEGADLHATVGAALAPFASDQRRRFAIGGPPAQVTARAALALSMALHELCTNAAKYGALSTPAGLVTVRWWLADGESGRRFCFTWTESGGPPVAAPEYRGFGSRLIETALASELSGSVRLEYAEAGVTFTLDADAAQVLSGDRPAPLRGTAA